MVLSSDYELIEIADEVIAVPVGQMATKCKDVFSFSKAGASLMRMLKYSVTNEEMIFFLTQTYDIDEDIAKKDLDKFITLLKENGIAYNDMN